MISLKVEIYSLSFWRTPDRVREALNSGFPVKTDRSLLDIPDFREDDYLDPGVAPDLIRVRRVIAS
jgi:hypothetical protein